MALALSGRHAVALAAVAIVALAACDTEPATDVDSRAATLNAKGGCAGTYSGTNEFQMRSYGSAGWSGCGHRLSVPNPHSHERRGRLHLRPHGHARRHRLRRLLDEEEITARDVYDQYSEQFVSDGGTSADASGATCRTKELKNPRPGDNWLGQQLWTVELIVRWRYCSNGQIVKMYPASAQCWLTGLGGASGWECLDPQGVKVRAYSTGGDPEHAVYTYSFRLQRHPPLSPLPIIDSTRWCATTQISGSGGHRRHGSCDIQPW